MTRIRQARSTDAPAWAAIQLAASPHLVLDARSEAHEMRTDPPDARRFVAEKAGTVVGVARSRVYADVVVAPEHRRRGTGRTVLDALRTEVAASGKAVLAERRPP